MQIYHAFIAKGSNVELPANTPILLRVNEELQSSSVGSVSSLAVAEDLDAKIETLLNTATQ
jgi:hypothetical protein